MPAPQRPPPVQHRPLALLYALACHGLFVAGAGSMQANLFLGMQHGLGPAGTWALPWNALIITQFVVFHSWLLSPGGKGVLRFFVPERLGGVLDSTVYGTLASVQIGLLFALWSPLPLPAYTLPGAAWWVSAASFAAGAAVLTVALWEGGLGQQLGWVGWVALFRGERPAYPRTFPHTGLHGVIRHPIYLGFILVLWLGPVWSVDKLIVGIPLTLYCLFGPRWKEARYRQRYGQAFVDYLERTPSFVPRLRPAAPSADDGWPADDSPGAVTR
jgi:protein-S-isoprenylcysteine O-methyltransferase Ste14